MSSPRFRWLVAAALLLATGCSQRGVIEVAEAELRTPNELVLIVNTCGGEPELSMLVETEVQVIVAVVSSSVDSGNDCQDPITVSLDDPLAERRLVDQAGGGEIEVRFRDLNG